MSPAHILQTLQRIGILCPLEVTKASPQQENKVAYCSAPRQAGLMLLLPGNFIAALSTERLQTHARHARHAINLLIRTCLLASMASPLSPLQTFYKIHVTCLTAPRSFCRSCLFPSVDRYMRERVVHRPLASLLDSWNSWLFDAHSARRVRRIETFRNCSKRWLHAEQTRAGGRKDSRVKAQCSLLYRHGETA